MSGINFKFTGTNDDVLKKIHQIQMNFQRYIIRLTTLK